MIHPEWSRTALYQKTRVHEPYLLRLTSTVASLPRYSAKPLPDSQARAVSSFFRYASQNANEDCLMQRWKSASILRCSFDPFANRPEKIMWSPPSKLRKNLSAPAILSNG